MSSERNIRDRKLASHVGSLGRPPNRRTSHVGPLATLTASGNPDLLDIALREWRTISKQWERTADDFTMCSMAATLRGCRATLRETGNGFSIALSVVAVVVLMALAGCAPPEAGDLDVENERPSLTGEGGVANPNSEIEASDEVETENAPDSPGDPPDAMISKGRHRAPVTGVHSKGVGSGPDRLDTDTETRLIEEQMRLRGRIDTLDSQLKAFDINPPSRAARESDPRGRPEAIERRLDLERRTLEAQDRQIRRELRQLRNGSSPRSIGSGSQGTSSQGLFGGSGMQ